VGERVRRGRLREPKPLLHAECDGGPDRREGVPAQRRQRGGGTHQQLEPGGIVLLDRLRWADADADAADHAAADADAIAEPDAVTHAITITDEVAVTYAIAFTHTIADANAFAITIAEPHPLAIPNSNSVTFAYTIAEPDPFAIADSNAYADAHSNGVAFSIAKPLALTVTVTLA
jgi:hypothetical protein